MVIFCRSEFRRWPWALIAGVVACVSPASGAADERPAPPNIVLIFADDLGWKDVGYHGSELIETPNLDRLAGEGMVFSSGYAAAGNCAPSRACLLSDHFDLVVEHVRDG
jgi:hypothetical protein